MPLLEPSNVSNKASPPQYHIIGGQMYVGSVERRRLVLINNIYYVVIDEINDVLKEYVWSDNRGLYVIDWEFQVSDDIIEEFRRETQVE